MSRSIEQWWSESYIDSTNTVRWRSNDSIPFADMLADFVAAGFITENMAKRATIKRERETAEFLANYRKNPPAYTNEQIAEMRAEFGEGETVVNIITGQRIQL